METNRTCNNCGADVSRVEHVTITCPACLESDIYPVPAVHRAAPALLAACKSVMENDCDVEGRGVCGHTWVLLTDAIALAEKD